MKKTTKAVFLISAILGVIYFSLMSVASNGYGYMGYYGYGYGPSFLYFGGPTTYYNRNVRSGSVSGAGVRGGGPGSGK
jgi:hypothetical protein